MAISSAIQALMAAFSFGILLQAASGALLIYFKGHARTIFQDGRRLVLVLFLFFAALWAQIDFLNLMIPSTTPTLCQASLVFSTMFDQLARVGMEQFLLWSVGQGTKVTAERLILQMILGVRLVAGGLLVGFTRPDFAPVCVARTSLMPMSILVITLDFIIIGVLFIRALALGMFRDLREDRSSTLQEQSKALILSIVGFTVWTGTSVPMILGNPSIILIVRTLVPANGLLILVGLVLIFQGGLLLPREDQVTTPEARSPFVTPTPPSREIFRPDIGNGSPIPGHSYTKSGNLFVVNPSSTPRDSPTKIFQGNYQGDTRGFTKLGGEITAREIVSHDQEQLARKNGPGYRGSSGVFPSILAAPLGLNDRAFAPQIRPAAIDRERNISAPIFPPPVSQQKAKKPLFNWPKTPANPTVRTLGISKPITDGNTTPSNQPFARMNTIDLATAAINERERREGAAARSRLVANRPAPLPPSLPPQEALRRSVSVKRKEMPKRSQEAMPTIASSASSGLSVEAANGSTTSTSLSPGREEVRRRSPRNFDTFDEKSFPKPTMQRNPTMGLPSNPRSQRITMAREAGMAKEQTVMFINDIVYDNPGMVKTIINGAPQMYATAKRSKNSEKSSPLSYTTNLNSSGSIIHRPRPYRRDSEKDRALFPSEPSPRHKRSKSGSSITSRKSVFLSHPGSPTQLPPLPPPPTSASKLKRLLPNDTTSMTFDEKIQLLFPAPPGAVSLHQRRSSVPSLPHVPSIFMSESPQAQSPIEELQNRRTSKRTTIASIAMPDNIITGGDLQEDAKKVDTRQTFRFSANTYRTLADEVGETWIPGIPSSEVRLPTPTQEHARRGSHEVHDMRNSVLTEATSSNDSHDSTTYWGSVHSEIPPVDLSKAMQTAQETFIQRGDRRQVDTSRDLPEVPQIEYSDSEEIMTVMLDSEENRQSILMLSDGNRQSFFLDADQALPGDKTPSPRNGRGWHRRIGDELPTFSERRSKQRSRKMPPPTPLLLNSKGRQATVVVRHTEPSPVESPEQALKEIQAQLKKFEEPNRGSVGSLLRHMPDAQSTGTDDAKDVEGGLRLLENLEREMGQQENVWQEMQTNLDRDSMSVIMTPQKPEPSESDISRESSQRSSRTPSRVLSRRARIRSSMTLRSKGDESTCTTSTQSSDNSRASIWQQRLAEAQMEYIENAPALLRKRSLNFLSVSKAQLESPTPPDSVDSGTDIEIESDSESDNEARQSSQTPGSIQKETASLWQVPLPSSNAATGRMWNPPYESSNTPAASPEPPAKNLRPAQRQSHHPLPISSVILWSKPRSASTSRPVIGLWGSKPSRPKSIITRRVTQRPQRKSKRVTFLPDIVESPVPVPNKRDTLGIFQFPWGELSDQPVYQPSFNPALLAGPMLNAKLEARSRQLEPEPTEYSSSFFDDYDEDNDDQEDAESDDDFDETTLWEIASLLKSKDVPSKNSLLPPPREIIEDYDDSTDFESDSENTSPSNGFAIEPLTTASKQGSQPWAGDLTIALAAVTTGLPQPEPHVWEGLIPPTDDIVRSKSRTSETLPVLATRELWISPSGSKTSSPTAPSMWNGKATAVELASPVMSSVMSSPPSMWAAKSPTTDDRHSGFFSADVSRNDFLATEISNVAPTLVRAPRPTAISVPPVSSRSLRPTKQNVVEPAAWLSKAKCNGYAHSTFFKSSLWTPALQIAAVASSGLFNASTPRSDYCTSSLLPAAVNMVSKPRATQATLSQLKSKNLWSRGEQPVEHHWISESSIRPDSPSIYSTTSSGRSSPASDTSSVASTSTKASSLWSSLGGASLSAVPVWSEQKVLKKSPPAMDAKRPKTPVDDAKNSSKIPVRQPLVTALAPVRKSRVLASRDLWEAKAPVLERKFRRSTVSQSPVEPVHRPLRHQHRPVLAFHANWDEALAEAIAAGTPWKLKRPIATETDWDNALDHAISQSKIRPQRPAYSSKMWSAAPSEAIDCGSAPITLSKTLLVVPETIENVNAQIFDPAVVHPVFFTESLVSNVEDVHPAAIGHVVRPAVTLSRSLLLVPDMSSKMCDAALAETIENVNAHIFDPSVLHPVFFTEPLVSTVEDIHPAAIGHVAKPTIDTVQVGQVLSASSSAAQKSSLAQTWTPRVVSPVQRISQPVASPSSSDMFTHVKGDNLKKASPRRPELPRLTSCKLFGSAPNSQPSSPHWLHETSAMAVTPNVSIPAPKALIRSQTWTAPVSGLTRPQESNSMWESRADMQIPSPTLFSNPHTETWTRKKRELMSAKEIESKEMWRPSRDMPESPKHWLIKRRFSRVEFRY